MKTEAMFAELVTSARAGNDANGGGLSWVREGNVYPRYIGGFYLNLILELSPSGKLYARENSAAPRLNTGLYYDGLFEELRPITH